MNDSDTRDLIETSENITTTYLGTRESQLGVEENVGIDDKNRMMHVLNIGPTGSGKTQMMIHAALQDIHSGRGLCVITPKGDAIDQILTKMPEDRMDDVIYLNPNEKPVTKINVLEPHIHDDMTEAQLENQKEIIVSDMVDLFRRHSKEWGDRFGRVLETLLRAHLDLNIKYNETNTLLDVYRCVTDDNELRSLIDKTDNEFIRNQLVRITDLTERELDPLHRRLDDYITNTTIQRVINTESSSIDFTELLDKDKILLVEVQKGEVGGTVAEIVGSMVITQIWAAAQSRIAIPEEERTPFMLMVDEVSNFAGEGSNFAKVLSEAREYKLGCWICSQFLHQLETEMRRAVTNNCRTKIFFEPASKEELTEIAGMLRGVGKDDLTGLNRFEAMMQQPSSTFNGAVTFQTFPPFDADRDRSDIRALKKQATVVNEDSTDVYSMLDLGPAGNAGEQVHTSLLQDAKQYLEDKVETSRVNLLHQDPGEERPDGHVVKESGEVAHLEAEVSTLETPAKVLKNLQRAAEERRKCIFAVEENHVDRLLNIVTDPVNRRGDDREDEDGTYSYYLSDGDPFTELNVIKEAEYRVVVRSRTGAVRDYSTETSEADCPEMDNETEVDDLRDFCLYRGGDGFCEKLEQDCVITS